MNSKINVLVLEHNSEWQIDIKRFYGDIIRSCGYDCTFIFIDQAKGKIIESKKNDSVFDKNEIDLFISDLSLGNLEGQFIGLHVIKKVKEEFPELVVIANSSEPVSTQIIAQHNPSFDLYVDKTKFPNNIYKEYISKLLNKLLNRNIYLNIDFEKSVFPYAFHIEKIAEKNKLINLLKFITFNSKEKDCSVVNVILRNIDEGKSSSFVFQMDGFLANGLKCINSIIKISKKEKSRIEKENYDKFVKWNLPYSWRVELLSYAEWQDYGCICYSFAFDDVSNKSITVKSVTDYIKIGQQNKLAKVLDIIFDPENVSWFSEKNIGTHSSILNYYYTKWFEGKKPITDSISIISSKLGMRSQNRLVIEDYSIPFPESILFMDRGEFLTCICHGDLNSNNILLYENSDNPIFIDFQDSGRGHVFVDFIVLENCFRLYYNQGKTMKELIKAEIELNKIILGQNNFDINSDDFRMYDIVTKIRRSAFKTFLKENRWTYIYGLAMSSYSRLRDLDRFDEWQINQIFASLFAAIYTLSQIKNTSPIKAESNVKVFASYSHRNKDVVKKIVNDLGLNGVLVWFDENNILIGDSIVNAIQDAISDNQVYLVFLGAEKGPWQSEEIEQIIKKKVEDKTKLIIPCILPDTLDPFMPGFLSTILHVDFNTNYTKKIEDLADRINQVKINI